MINNLPESIRVFVHNSGSHIQGIAIDKEHKFMYCSFTTCLLKVDIKGNIVGSVKGLVGHLGCIAYNPYDGRVYGSLEFKNDSIGKGILKKLGDTQKYQEGFYIVCFDVDKIDRLDINAENNDIMKAVYLKEVFDDYSAKGHRFGCSGIDGVTFAPAIGENSDEVFLYVAYGIYGDITRTDNDYQVILQYDVSKWDQFAKTLDQGDMHRLGPQKPDNKYFVYTGNTTYGIQNLEYDSYTNTMIAAVYQGKKEQFPNYPMYFICCSEKPQMRNLKGSREKGLVVPLSDIKNGSASTEICGSAFPYGSTGIISLGDGLYYFADHFKNDDGYGGNIDLYKIDAENSTFVKV